MDYLLSIFFNSNTADDPIDPKTQKLKYPDFDPRGEIQLLRPVEMALAPIPGHRLVRNR